MLTEFPFSMIVGSILGFLSGLGIGGGSLLLLWLTQFLAMAPEIARGINLLFFLPSAVVSSFYRIRHGALSLSPLLPAILSGCISAVLFSCLSSVLPVGIMRKGFGFLLLATGFRELFYKKKVDS